MDPISTIRTLWDRVTSPFTNNASLNTPQGNTIDYNTNDPNGRNAALNIQGSFDADNTVLSSWFKMDPINGEHISIVPSANGAGHYPYAIFGLVEGAVRQGPHYMGVGDDPSLLGDVPTSALATAEQIENYEIAQGKGWDPGHTNGEALSRLGAATLHPELNPWIQSDENTFLKDYGKDWIDGHYSQGNYITNNNASDTDPDGNGQGELFMQWLSTQNDKNGNPITMDSMAQAGGSNLGETYKNLTGNDPQTGLGQFAAALRALPTDDQGNPTVNGTSGNPFPSPAPNPTPYQQPTVPIPVPIPVPTPVQPSTNSQTQSTEPISTPSSTPVPVPAPTPAQPSTNDQNHPPVPSSTPRPAPVSDSSQGPDPSPGGAATDKQSDAEQN